MFKTMSGDTGLSVDNVGTEENPVYKKKIVNKALFCMFVLHIILYALTIVFACVKAYYFLIFSGYMFFFCFPLDVIIYKYFVVFKRCKAELVDFEEVCKPSALGFLNHLMYNAPFFGIATYKYTFEGVEYETKVVNPLVNNKDIGKFNTIFVLPKQPSFVLSMFDFMYSVSLFLVVTMFFTTSFDRVKLFGTELGPKSK